MSDSHVTKQALAASIKELMSEMHMNKIDIADIERRWNMNRQSFYYRFKDKYDWRIGFTIQNLSQKLKIICTLLREIYLRTFVNSDSRI